MPRPGARNRPAQDNPAGPPSADPPAGPPAAPQPEGRTRGPGAAPEGGRAAERPRRRRSAGGTPPLPPSAAAAAAGFADEEWPDDASGPGSGAEDLTGMELIQRQLGGRVIQEIEDS